MSHISGLALSIRSSLESDTFDLAGQNATTITNTISSAFTEAFPLKGEMIRITLVTGAGKLGRQKYDEGAAKAVTSTLRKIGFEDDSSASCVPQCAGTFKLQHDTGKNLKTVVIFPKILSVEKEDADELQNGVNTMNLDSSHSNSNSLLREGTPEHTCAVLSLDAFQKLIQSKCQSWSQKRECLHLLTNIVEALTKVEAKLLNGQPLTDDEQDFYDNLSIDLLQNKESYLKKEIASHVENKKITKYEKTQLLNLVDEKLSTLDIELTQATKENKPKKILNLKTAQEKATKRRKMLYDIDPTINPHQLKYGKEIMKLRKEMQPLIRLETSTKGRLMTLKETTALGRKIEIVEEIEHLEDASREWFEDDDVFKERLKFHHDTIKLKEKEQQKKQVRKPPGGSSNTSSGFTSTNSYKAKPMKSGGWGTAGGGSGKSSQQKKSSGGGGSSVFSSMLMDSDSD